MNEFVITGNLLKLFMKMWHSKVGDLFDNAPFEKLDLWLNVLIVGIEM